MDVSEIRQHLSIAEGSDFAADAHRWAAARGIYEHLGMGKSLRQVAEELGRSHMHVQYYKRVWILGGIGVWEALADKDDVVFPDFKTIYYSDEVRGGRTRASAKGRRDPHEDDDDASGKNREEHEDDSPDYTAHGLITSAAGSISALYRRRGEWATLSEEDRIALAKVANQILTIGTH